MKSENFKYTREDICSLLLCFAFASGSIGAISACMQYYTRALVLAAACVACVALAWIFNRRRRRG